MSKVFLFASLSVFMAIGLILTGCSNQQPSQQPSASPEVPHSQYDKELSQLSAADRALAEVQKACPVCRQPLGSMGKPYKVPVNDREVFLCCKGCEGKIDNSLVQ